MSAERPQFEEKTPLTPIEQFKKSIQEFTQDQAITPDKKRAILKKFDPKIVENLRNNNLHDGKIGVLTTTTGKMTDEERTAMTDLGMYIHYPKNRIQRGHVAPDKLLELAKTDTIRYISHSILSKKTYS